MALVYNGISHVVMMATSKDLAAFAIGFSLSEGIIAFPDDIYDIWQQPGWPHRLWHLWRGAATRYYPANPPVTLYPTLCFGNA